MVLQKEQSFHTCFAKIPLLSKWNLCASFLKFGLCRRTYCYKKSCPSWVSQLFKYILAWGLRMQLKTNSPLTTTAMSTKSISPRASTLASQRYTPSSALVTWLICRLLFAKTWYLPSPDGWKQKVEDKDRKGQKNNRRQREVRWES